MPPPPERQHTRINVGELKSQILKRLGPENANMYFSYLDQFLSGKLSKPEFNRRCLYVLGHKNIRFHNQLIFSILKNAFLAKSPPLQGNHEQKVQRNLETAEHKKLERSDEPCHGSASAALHPVWCNGEILPSSPRRVRSSVRDKRIKDRSSPLVPNGHVDVLAQHFAPMTEGMLGNGILNPCGSQMSLHHTEQPTKLSHIDRVAFNVEAPLHSKNPVEVSVRGESEQMRESTMLLRTEKVPLQPPLGIPFCPVSVGGSQRTLPTVGLRSIGSNYCSGELCCSEVLKTQMDHLVAEKGLEGTTLDCADLLNNAVDSYLRQLIRSSIDIGSARSSQKLTKHPIHRHQSHLNSILPGNQKIMQTTNGHLQGTNRPYQILFEDFRVAMELNPQQLGENWPLLLEKINAQFIRGL